MNATDMIELYWAAVAVVCWLIAVVNDSAASHPVDRLLEYPVLPVLAVIGAALVFRESLPVGWPLIRFALSGSIGVAVALLAIFVASDHFGPGGLGLLGLSILYWLLATAMLVGFAIYSATKFKR